MNMINRSPLGGTDLTNGTGSCACAVTAKAAHCTSSCYLKDDSFKERARRILTSGKKVTAGAVHLIGLEEIRARLADRWESVKGRVQDYTERLLQKVLSPQDVWFRHGEASYIIVFARADRQAAQLICGRIVESLHQSLLGHSDTRRITVRTALVDIDGSVAVDTARLDELLRAAAAGTPPAAPAEPVPPVSGQSRSDVRRAALGDPAFAGGRPARPKVLFRPVYDVKNKVISTYTCRPDMDTCRSLSQAGYFSMDDVRHEEAIFDYDMETLCHAISTYNELFRNKFRYAQTIPVHFETLASARRRREYIQTCRMIPSYLIPFLAFELDGLPPGVPGGRLGDMVAMLRPFGRAALAMAREDAADIPVYATAGVRGVGLSLDFRDSEARCIERMQGFCSAARRVGLFAYVDGVRNAALLQAATELGVAYLGGLVVGEDSEVPQHMKRCTERQMLMRARVKANRAPR